MRTIFLRSPLAARGKTALGRITPYFYLKGDASHGKFKYTFRQPCFQRRSNENPPSERHVQSLPQNTTVSSLPTATAELLPNFRARNLSKASRTLRLSPRAGFVLRLKQEVTPPGTPPLTLSLKTVYFAFLPHSVRTAAKLSTKRPRFFARWKPSTNSL